MYEELKNELLDKAADERHKLREQVAAEKEQQQKAFRENQSKLEEVCRQLQQDNLELTEKLRTYIEYYRGVEDGHPPSTESI